MLSITDTRLFITRMTCHVTEYLLTNAMRIMDAVAEGITNAITNVFPPIQYGHNLIIINQDIADANQLSSTTNCYTTCVMYTHEDTESTFREKVRNAIGSNRIIQNIACVFHGIHVEDVDASEMCIFNGPPFTIGDLRKNNQDAIRACTRSLFFLASLGDTKRIDLMACNLANEPAFKHIKSYMETHGIILAASTGEGGDWVLEDGGINVGRIYFNEKMIKHVKTTLSSATKRLKFRVKDKEVSIVETRMCAFRPIRASSVAIITPHSIITSDGIITPDGNTRKTGTVPGTSVAVHEADFEDTLSLQKLQKRIEGELTENSVVLLDAENMTDRIPSRYYDFSPTSLRQATVDIRNVMAKRESFRSL